ncbi:hypothetical protein NIES4102_16190 [Chondrocystis sp. NIES-4102]|nr:hypothetical protein NIES4102_16190 [Chondrocystis sp. NIES-4102]
MVAINPSVDNSIAVELAKPIDAVGKLEINTSTTGFFRKFNTGTATLVTPNKILTAAHVIDPNLDGVVDVTDFSQYSFLLGDNLETDADYNLKISQVSLHPSWLASEANRFTSIDGKQTINSRYDLAVLTLDQNFTDIAPIAISPNIPELADNASILGQTGTMIGYGEHGDSDAYKAADGLRRGAENVIESVDNGIIRFDYDDSDSLDGETGLNAPSLDSSSPELIPVPTSSPTPIPLEGGIGQGDSGGPLLVVSKDAGPVIVGVASQVVDTEFLGGFVSSGYGSVYVYSGFNDPETVRFLGTENIINPSSTVAADLVLGSGIETIDTSNDIFGSQNNELDFLPTGNDMFI